jgi:hypothetical protein
MSKSKFWIAVLAGGVIANIIDYIFQAQLFTNIFYSKMTDVMRQDTNILWFVFGDFVQVFVLAWVFNKVGSVFGGGIKGGATCGFYLGVLVSFPTYHFFNLMFKGFSYGLTWASTIYGIAWYVVIGVVLAAMLKKGQVTASTP